MSSSNSLCISTVRPTTRPPRLQGMRARPARRAITRRSTAQCAPGTEETHQALADPARRPPERMRDTLEVLAHRPGEELALTVKQVADAVHSSKCGSAVLVSCIVGGGGGTCTRRNWRCSSRHSPGRNSSRRLKQTGSPLRAGLLAGRKQEARQQEEQLPRPQHTLLRSRLQRRRAVSPVQERQAQTALWEHGSETPHEAVPIIVALCKQHFSFEHFVRVLRHPKISYASPGSFDSTSA